MSDERHQTPVMREYQEALRVLSEMNLRIKAQYEADLKAAETRKLAVTSTASYKAAVERHRLAHEAAMDEERRRREPRKPSEPRPDRREERKR